MSAGAVSQLPRDLFFPQPGTSTQSRALELPGGATGEMIVTARADIVPGSGLLVASNRDIVTRVAGISRLAGEAWSLASA